MSDFAAGTRLDGPRVTFPTLTLGEVDAAGVEWIVSRLEGWDSPATQGDVQGRFRQSGGWAMPFTYAPRQVNISGRAGADSARGREVAEDALFGAVSLFDQVMVVERDTAGRRAMVRQNGQVVLEQVNAHVFDFSLSLIALDPLRYSTVEHFATTTLPTYAGGLQAPFQAPFGVPTTFQTGQLVLVNAGTVATYPRWRVVGPVLRPRVTLDGDSSRSWWLDLAVADGQFVDVDTSTGDVLVGGTGSRTDALRGQLEPLRPGATAAVFTAEDYNTTARLEARHRDAWL